MDRQLQDPSNTSQKKHENLTLYEVLLMESGQIYNGSERSSHPSNYVTDDDSEDGSSSSEDGVIVFEDDVDSPSSKGRLSLHVTKSLEKSVSQGHSTTCQGTTICWS